MCLFQHWQALCKAVPDMDCVLKKSSNEKRYGRDESKGKRTFEAFDANNVRRLPCSQSSEYRYGTGSAGAASISRCYDLCREKPSLVRVL